MKHIFNRLLAIVAMVALSPILQAQTAQQLQTKAAKGDTKAMIKLAQYYESGLQGVPLDTLQAIRLYEQAIAKGSADAKALLARFYSYSLVVPRDSARRFALASQSYQEGSMIGASILGLCYLNGIGCTPDTNKALSLINESANAGCAEGLFALGNIYYWGRSVPANRTKSVEYFKKAYAAGSQHAAGALAQIYSEFNYKEMWKWIYAAKASGDVVGYNVESTSYFWGCGVDRNQAKALELASQNLDQLPSNQLLLRQKAMLLHHMSDQHQRDTSAARNLLRNLATPDPYSLNMLVDFYLQGRDFAAAKAIADKAVSMYPDDEDVLWCAGSYYLIRQRQCSHADSVKAFDYLRRAADKNNDAALYFLAETYMKGNSMVAKDSLEAIKLLKRGARCAGEYCTSMLADCYSNNESTDKELMDLLDNAILNLHPEGYSMKARALSNRGASDKEIVKVLSQGSETGFASAKLLMARGYNAMGKSKKALQILESLHSGEGYRSIAMMYYDGDLGPGGDANLAKVLQYMTKAAALDDAVAIRSLGSLYGTDDYGIKNCDIARGYLLRAAELGDNQAYFNLGQLYERAECYPADSAKSVYYYRKAYEVDDNLSAAEYLADLYRDGKMVPQNYDSAFFYYSVACADRASADAALADLYMKGLGTAVDTSKALSHLLEAASFGYGPACYRLFLMYRDGVFVQANSDTANHYLSQGSQADDPDCDYVIGEDRFWNNSNTCFGYLYSAYKNGSSKAWVLLGACMAKGWGMDPNPTNAYTIYRRAVDEMQDYRGYYFMGMAHYNGSGCLEDENLAKLYIDSAAHLGVKQAMYTNAMFYLNAIGCNRDTVQFFRWIKQAADSNEASALNVLAECYTEGYCVEQDLAKAAELYQRNIDHHGNFNAIISLGEMYEEGNGVVLNSKKAYDLYMLAAENGNAKGMIHVASCYLEGIHVAANADSAIVWLQRAAGMGSADAAYNLGYLYEYGEYGVARNYKLSAQWYDAAAQLGHTMAADALKRVKKKK